MTGPGPDLDAVGDGPAPTLRTVLLQWGRLGCIGFGGPPTHIRLLRQLCVNDRRWIQPVDFDDAVAACNLLPGPASTQLAIFCGWHVRRRPGALVAGVAFIVPGLIVILALAAVFLGSPPRWVLAAGAGAGAAVPAVALQAASSLLAPSWRRAHDASRSRAARWVGYLAAGAAASAVIGAWVVLVLLGCGVLEAILRRPAGPARTTTGGAHGVAPLALLGKASVGISAGALPAVCWVALKVGALSYGGGFVIIPLMQSDAVHRYHWMTNAQFLNAVALGQITPGPVVQTVAVVGYSAAGLLGGVLASAVAFSPSFLFILLGADHFDRLRRNPTVRAFLDGAGPAAIGAIAGSAVPLTRALSQAWQYAILAGAAVLLLAVKRGPVPALLAGAAVAVVLVALGAPLAR